MIPSEGSHKPAPHAVALSPQVRDHSSERRRGSGIIIDLIRDRIKEASGFFLHPPKSAAPRQMAAGQLLNRKTSLTTVAECADDSP